MGKIKGIKQSSRRRKEAKKMIPETSRTQPVNKEEREGDGKDKEEDEKEEEKRKEEN